jgi:hypothetical protein
MELIGAIVLICIVGIGVIWMVKHQQAISWWMQTPKYNKKYKEKMLRRRIEDAEEELEDLKSRED